MKRSILVVDDEMDMRQLHKRSLEPDLDCKTHTADSGEMALQILSKQSFDLVLANIRMQSMDGLELLELIKRANPDQTVVMFTGEELIYDPQTSGRLLLSFSNFQADELIVDLNNAEVPVAVMFGTTINSSVGVVAD